MNRWSDAFEKHAFHPIWNGLVEKLDETKLGAEVNENIVTEFVRFEKVVKLIQSILESLDQDTFHLQTLVNAQKPTQQAIAHYTNFMSNQNDLTHIQGANNQIDQVLNFFRPYMVMPDAVAKGVKDVSNSQQKLISQLNQSLIDIKDNQLKELKEAIEISRQHLIEMDKDAEKSDVLCKHLFGEDGSSGLSQQIESLHKSLQSIEDQATQANQSIQSLEQNSNQSNARIKGFETSSQQSSDEITQLLTDTESELDELKDLYLKVFGKPNEEGELIGGMKNELEEYKQSFIKYEEEHKTKIEELIKEIEGLLPGALSAGLAKAYRQLKVECDDPIKKFTNQFYGSLAILLLLGVVSFIFAIKANGDLESLAYNFLQASPIIVPAVWFALFTSRRRNEFQRLRQEYAHKEAVTSSYQSFKQQIDNLDDNQAEMLTALMSTAIKTIDFNATQALDKHKQESTPVNEVVDRFISGTRSITQGQGRENK